MNQPRAYALSLSQSLSTEENDKVFAWIGRHGNCSKLFESVWVFQSPFSTEVLAAHFEEMLPPKVLAFLTAVDPQAEELRVDRDEWLWRT